MKSFANIIVLFLFGSSTKLITLANDEKEPTCPTISTVGDENFDLDEWIRATWYVQAQQLTTYSPPEDLYCLTATYNLEERRVPFFAGTVISVYNRGTKSDFLTDNSDGLILCGRVNPNDGSKISVSPCFLPNIFSGPYWPIYIDQDEDSGNYTTAVVSGGQTNIYMDGTEEDGNVLCTTTETEDTNSGLWIISRDEEISEEKLGEVKQALNDMGIYTGLLRTIPQGPDCAESYQSRFIKPRDCGDDGIACNPSDDIELGACASISYYFEEFQEPLLIVGNLLVCAYDITIGSVIGAFLGA